MPMPTKPAEKRQRRNKPHEIDAQIVALNTENVPAAPEELPKHLIEQWEGLWTSELAAVFTASDLPALHRLFRLYADEESFTKQGMERPISLGSKEQEQLNPRLKYAQSMRNEILSLEDRFGLNPQSRLKLGISLGEAQKSLDDMNRRLTQQARAGGVVTERPDPRIAAIDTTAS